MTYKGNEPVVHYGELRALVVDDFPGMRSALKLTLANFGVTRIELAANAGEAIFKVQNGRYDLVLCDYNLGEGRDGQQLLEELRFRHLMPLATVFIVVTAESGYEKVVATAELAPDDYLIKPFSAELMRSRLEHCLLKKLTFAAVYRHFETHELEQALQGCDEIVKTRPKYVIDALRLKGEVLNALGRFDQAEALYRQIIDMRAIPWARLGLARALHQQKQADAAKELLHDMIEHSPELVAAYDLLAEVCLSSQDGAGAQQALQRGVAISAKTVRRQQRLGEVAFDNGDLATARAAYGSALEKGRNSIFVTPADYGHLCRVQVEQGDAAAALETLKQARTVLQASADGQFVGAVVRGLVHAKAGNAEEAGRALDEANRLNQEGARADARFMLDYADACMAGGRHEQADGIVQIVARNAHDSDALLAKAKQIYAQAGRAEVGESLLKAATSAVRDLNNAAVILAQQGDYAAAVDKMRAACQEAPHNPRILMNTVWVMLKHLESGGIDHQLLDQARAWLADVERLAPGHGRLATLRAQLREVEARHGMRRA